MITQDSGLMRVDRIKAAAAAGDIEALEAFLGARDGLDPDEFRAVHLGLVKAYAERNEIVPLLVIVDKLLDRVEMSLGGSLANLTPGGGRGRRPAAVIGQNPNTAGYAIVENAALTVISCCQKTGRLPGSTDAAISDISRLKKKMEKFRTDFIGNKKVWHRLPYMIAGPWERSVNRIVAMAELALNELGALQIKQEPLPLKKPEGAGSQTQAQPKPAQATRRA